MRGCLCEAVEGEKEGKPTPPNPGNKRLLTNTLTAHTLNYFFSFFALLFGLIALLKIIYNPILITLPG